MALKAARTDHPTTVGHVSHDALVRIDVLVKDILARRDTALRQARMAARRYKRPKVGRLTSTRSWLPRREVKRPNRPR